MAVGGTDPPAERAVARDREMLFSTCCGLYPVSSHHRVDAHRRRNAANKGFLNTCGLGKAKQADNMKRDLSKETTLLDTFRRNGAVDSEI